MGRCNFNKRRCLELLDSVKLFAAYVTSGVYSTITNNESKFSLLHVPLKYWMWTTLKICI